MQKYINKCFYAFIFVFFGTFIYLFLYFFLYLCIYLFIHLFLVMSFFVLHICARVINRTLLADLKQILVEDMGCHPTAKCGWVGDQHEEVPSCCGCVWLFYTLLISLSLRVKRIKSVEKRSVFPPFYCGRKSNHPIH